MRVIVADDDRLVCDSLRIILGAQEGIEVCGTGSCGADALRLWQEVRPDVALLDIQMPGSDGMWAAKRILAEDPSARVVFLTTFSDDEYIVRALKLGVAAIAPALEQVMAGRRVLEGKAIEDVDLDAADADVAPAGEAGPPAAFSCLTERELEVARLVAEGLDNKEISSAAYMGEGTVRNHISSILAKLGLRNRTQIAIAYLRG